MKGFTAAAYTFPPATRRCYTKDESLVIRALDMAEIFISYARKDDRELALRLQGSLVANGHSAWLDTSIAGGAMRGSHKNIRQRRRDCPNTYPSPHSLGPPVARAWVPHCRLSTTPRVI